MTNNRYKWSNWDSKHSSQPSVIKEGSLYKMWYGAHDGTKWRIMYSMSPDGTTWQDMPLPLMSINIEGNWDTSQSGMPTVIREGDTYHMWYGASDGTNYRTLYTKTNFRDEISGNDGSRYGTTTPTKTTGKLGNAFTFDGTSDYISLGNASDFDLTTKLTITAWIKPATITEGDTSPKILCKWNNQNAEKAFNLFMSTTTLRCAEPGEIVFSYSQDGTSNDWSCAETTITPNEWHHVALTYDGPATTAKFYINGQLTNTTILNSLKSTPRNLQIGAGMSSGTESNYFNGTIDELTLWNRRLTAEEVFKIYNLGTRSIGNVTTFSTTYGTTDFYAVSNLSSVSSMKLAVPKALVKWAGTVDAKNQDYDSNIKMGNGFVSVDTDNLDSSIDSEATVSLEDVDCDNLDPKKILYSPTHQTTLDSVHQNGKTCPSDVCTNIVCSSNTLNFTVTGFSGYAYGANANLTIDANDPKEVLTQVTFTANYTDTSDDHISGATCNITLPDGKGTQDMSESGEGYLYNTTFSSAGIKEYNVTCGKASYSQLMANDTFEITPASGEQTEVPELSDYAVLILITLLFGGMIMANRKSNL